MLLKGELVEGMDEGNKNFGRLSKNIIEPGRRIRECKKTSEN